MVVVGWMWRGKRRRDRASGGKVGGGIREGMNIDEYLQRSKRGTSMHNDE